MLFKKFFVVSGVGLSKTSKLNAFDNALMDAGISQCNLVKVSSILPKKAEQIESISIEPGTITFAVLARKDGKSKETISAGLGWVFCTNSKNKDTYGIVIEEDGLKTENEIKKKIKLKIKEMTKNRKMKIKKQNMKIADIKRIPEGHYGSAIVALVYTD